MQSQLQREETFQPDGQKTVTNRIDTAPLCVICFGVRVTTGGMSLFTEESFALSVPTYFKDIRCCLISLYMYLKFHFILHTT